MRKPEDGGGARSRSGETRNQSLSTKGGAEYSPLQPNASRSSSGGGDESGGGDTERLNKALARAGIASRRHVDDLIRDGKVKVNGEVVTQLGVKIDVAHDRVQLDGKRVQLIAPDQQVKVYFLLNKPAGVLTTVKDDRDRRTVMGFVAGAHEGRIYPVGRLDYDAEGAIILTNDGELAARLMAPKSHIPKVYRVKVKGEPSEEKLAMLRKGVRLEDGMTKPAEIHVVGKARVNTWVEVTLTEGKNRQLKRMFWKIRNPVMKIVRITYGPLELGELQPGQFRELSRAEVEKLRRATE